MRCCCSRWPLTLGYDNWRTGIGWDSTGPQPGYFPFYLSVILAAASLYGLVKAVLSRELALKTFVTRAQLRRVMAVFVPTLLFCLVTQFLGHLCRELAVDLGLHAPRRQDRAGGSRLLPPSSSRAIMFVTFDIVFDVIMPKGPLEAAFGY